MYYVFQVVIAIFNPVKCSGKLMHTGSGASVNELDPINPMQRSEFKIFNTHVCQTGSVTYGRRRLGAADWAPPFGRPPFGRRDIYGRRDKWAPPFGRWTFRRYTVTSRALL